MKTLKILELINKQRNKYINKSQSVLIRWRGSKYVSNKLHSSYNCLYCKYHRYTCSDGVCLICILMKLKSECMCVCVCVCVCVRARVCVCVCVCARTHRYFISPNS